MTRTRLLILSVFMAVLGLGITLTILGAARVFSVLGQPCSRVSCLSDQVEFIGIVIMIGTVAIGVILALPLSFLTMRAEAA